MVKKQKKGIFIGFLCLFALIYIAVILWHTYKPLPEGVSFEGNIHKTNHVEFITDLTYAQDREGTGMIHENHIFEEVNTMINEAKEFVVVDFFLFDGYYDEDEDFPKIADNLSTTLANKKEENPNMPVVFITDPLNRGYGSYENEWFKKMRDAGVEIVYTDLDPLRDSTPIYSGIYRIFFQWFDIGGKGWIANAMASDAPKMTIASYMTLLNVKANHRKAVITEKEAMVTSSNPHDASGFHGNIALTVDGPIINDILKSEEVVSLFSGGPKLPRIEAEEVKGEYEVQYLTEKKILDKLLADVAVTKKGDKIWLGMFFVAKRDIVNALIDAANRGVEVNLILDPNENSFGQEKSGLPNRPVVQEMVEDTDGKMNIRWYNTVIGQYHTKAIWIQTKEHTIISNGSANYTERTLDNYNLENNLRVLAPNDSELVLQMEDYFERLWNNEDAMYTVDLEEFQDEFTWWQRWIYSLQKLLKITTY
ncbi:phospholipase D family protein [Psychrobacillus sp. NEAU-3TGS]|uniref:phospholipase D family protein n=1 Tax=Psychrobacillus sp. NEAU-3TGS TaxID=2995412 RepID=UPI0024999152|nr:phospholipase D family protein [Psychrobacillus sp. NEAU-3TGS]MDI2588359.1 phospholipase D family protein [Psychrobacillus sp. NEAU-3TGS]